MTRVKAISLLAQIVAIAGYILVWIKVNWWVALALFMVVSGHQVMMTLDLGNQVRNLIKEMAIEEIENAKNK